MSLSLNNRLHFRKTPSRSSGTHAEVANSLVTLMRTKVYTVDDVVALTDTDTRTGSVKRRGGTTKFHTQDKSKYKVSNVSVGCPLRCRTAFKASSGEVGHVHLVVESCLSLPADTTTILKLYRHLKVCYFPLRVF